MAIQKESVSLDWGGRTLEIETGRFASLAGGSVTVRYGDTIVLVSATMAKHIRPGLDFFPLRKDVRRRKNPRLAFYSPRNASQRKRDFEWSHDRPLDSPAFRKRRAQ